MADKKAKSDKLTATGKGEANYFRARQNNSRAFWDRVDASESALQKANRMANAHYGDKAEKVREKLNAYGAMGDDPTEKTIKQDAATAKRLKDKVLADAEAQRKRLIENYKTRGYAKGGSVASKRGDGIATKGKTKGKFV